jgi:hypothetical protein
MALRLRVENLDRTATVEMVAAQLAKLAARLGVEVASEVWILRLQETPLSLSAAPGQTTEEVVAAFEAHLEARGQPR